MADVEQLATALRNADAAGDVEAARALASALVAARGGAGPQPSASSSALATSSPRNSVLGKVDTAARGLADTLSFGMADEFAGAMDATFNPVFGTGQGGASWGERYAKNVGRERQTDKDDSDQRFGYRLGGQLAGGLTGGIGLAKSGLSATTNAINAGKSLPKVAMASAGEGLVLGAAQGAGSGVGLEGRLESAGAGALTGGVIGGLAPPVIAGATMVAKPLIAPVMARLRPEEYANAAIGDGLRRSGSSADDIAGRLASARADGQDMYTVADAMGNSGQRMISTVVRNPNDARQRVAEALIGRQMDQGGRVAQSLQEASGSPLTASQFGEMLGAERSAAAARNYAPVKSDLGAIDVTAPVSIANRGISPAADILAAERGAVPTDLASRSAIEAQEASIRDPIRETLKQARSYLASDNLTATNVAKAFAAKTNIDQMIADATANNQGARVAALMPMQEALDQALAKTSQQYGTARDAYAAASRPIEAIETGKQMASPRSRVGDNLSAFGALDEPSQQAARVGFFDPLIGRAESTAGQMSNAARPFASQSMREQLPVFAAPGTAPQLERRLAREQRMFDTTREALGGSKTADNLADAAEMAKFDPGIMTKLMQGRPVAAIAAALSKGKAEAAGLPPRVIERIAEVLIERNPQAALQMLSSGARKNEQSDAIRSIANALIVNSGASSGGRLAAP